MKARAPTRLSQRQILAGVRKPMPPAAAPFESKKSRLQRRRVKRVDVRLLPERE
ncbi:MAG TPA: hypothetical protein VFE31_10620 [Opitutaceae bacterium]|jgi:hypothetical protein|nr:hypothetical protein [Opitutaceae bacterium]